MDWHPLRRRKLPVILAPGEVAAIVSRVRSPKAKACLWTTYSWGLRRSEAVALTVDDIDLRTIQEALGHTSPSTTAIDTHVTDKNVAHRREALDGMLAKL